MPTLEDASELIETLEMTCPDYKNFRVVDGHVHCLAPFIFTWAILGECTLWGYERRWCYGTYEEALKASLSWDGKIDSEPVGWKKRIG